MKSFIKLVFISVQGRIYYKASFFMNLLTPIVLLLGQYVLWNSLYSEQSMNIGGMNRADMFSFILISFSLNNILTWSSENILSRKIRNGTITSRCIRPTSFFLQFCSETVGNMIPQAIVNFMTVILGFMLFSGYLTFPTFMSTVVFIPCLLLSIFLRIMLVEVFSLLCFYSTGHLGIAWTRRGLFEFFSGVLIPVSLFPHMLKIVAYLTPFPYMIQVPVALLLRQKIPVTLPFVFYFKLYGSLYFGFCNR